MADKFTDRFTSKRKEPSGKHAFDRECVALKIEHRLIKARHPQTNGMLERFNGRISDILATTRFRSGEDLKTTLERYVRSIMNIYHFRALKAKTPLEAVSAWHKEKPELLVVKPKNNHAGLDT